MPMPSSSSDERLRNLSVGRKFVDQHGQQLGQMRARGVGRNPCLGGEFLYLFAAQNMLNLIGGNGEVLARADPGMTRPPRPLS